MATSEPGVLVLALLAGGVLGAMFFGGLWWTVRRGAASGKPARWFFASALLRMGLALAGLHFVAGGQLDRLLLCLLGFVVARTAVKWLTRPRAERPAPASKEVHHAP